MKKLFIVFLFFTTTGYAQDINSNHWPANEKEAEFSGVNIPGVLTAQQEKNLAVLCRVWGFLKYFHPKAATGSVDADKALFAILPVVLEAKNNESRDIVLLKWIEKLGNINSVISETLMPNVFIQPDMQWLMKDSVIYGKLRQVLLNIFNNRQTGGKYYVRLANNRNPDFSSEFKYPNVKGEDDGMRILALFRYWNTIEYFFPSKYLTVNNWDSVLGKLIPVFVKAKTDSMYRMACSRLIASIHDTHGMIGLHPFSQRNRGEYSLPVTLADIENGITVLFHRYDSLKENSPLKPGDRILAINGVDVGQLMDSVKQYVPASNTSSLTYYAMNKLTRGYLAENELTIKRSGHIMKVKVSYFQNSISVKNARWYYTSIYPMYKKTGDDIGYINLEKIKADSLPAIFKAFKHTAGLVIDSRNYPSQFVPFALVAYLKPQPSPFARFTYPDLQLPGRFIMMEPVVNGVINPDYYKGKIVILVNEVSMSQSEYTIMALRSAPNAIVMGSQTSGADGDVSSVFLPGGMYSLISGLGVYYPDKKATQGIGIVPDIEVKPTIKGIAEERDELLEKALQYIRANK